MYKYTYKNAVPNSHSCWISVGGQIKKDLLLQIISNVHNLTEESYPNHPTVWGWGQGKIPKYFLCYELQEMW